MQNVAAVAIELYLKSLSAEEEWKETRAGLAFEVHAKPAKRTHVLVELFDTISEELRNKMEPALTEFEGQES